MPVTLNANSSTGFIATSDTSGVLQLQTGGTTALTVDASQNVTLAGTLTATGVTTVPAGTVSAPAITTTGDTNTGIYFPAADTIAFTEGGTEAMRINSSGNLQTIGTISVGNATPSTSGAGITFPAAINASSDANTLDDYEEGAFTPTVSSGDGNMSGISYVSQQGVYTKIGRVVYFRFQVGFSATTIGTGNFRINGLPFTQFNGSEYRQVSPISIYNLNWDATWMQIMVEGSTNDTTMLLLISRDNATWTNLLASDMANSTTYYYQASGWYTATA
jgi:hypothetical protein